MFTDALFEIVKRRERQMNRQLQLQSQFATENAVAAANKHLTLDTLS